MIDSDKVKNFEKNFLNSKSKEQLNKEGQFFTPRELSEQITKLTMKYFNLDRKIKFLEPSIGTGSFYQAFKSVVDPEFIDTAVGIEKDFGLYSFLKDLFIEDNLEILNQDFLNTSEFNEKFNLLIGNPPYTRHQHLTSEQKAYLKNKVRETLGLNVSGYAGLYIYFILLAHSYLEYNALASWLIPTEFMSVNYGIVLKKYLLEKVTLKQIHIFKSENMQFDNALVTSSIIIYRNELPMKNHKIKITYGCNIDNPEKEIFVSINDLQSEDKWNNLIKDYNGESIKDKVTIGDLFDIKRGIATGNNELFVISENTALELGLTKEFYRYLIPASKKIKSEIIYADQNGKPITDEELVLINTNLPMEELKYKNRNLYDYFKTAESEGKNKTYLLSKRNPWYRQENREVPLFICTYMGRNKKNSDKPFNIYLNLSQAIVTNNYLMMYPKGKLKEIIEKYSESSLELLKILNSVHQNSYDIHGREYGGGLKKIEPKEFKNIPVEGINDFIKKYS